MPIYAYLCQCGHQQDELRSIENRNGVINCPACAGYMVRDFGAETPNMLRTEKKFKPYRDMGTGRYYKTRAEQQADWKAKGLVGLTGREFKDQFERGLANPVKPWNEGEQREKWNKAAIKAKRKCYEKRRIVVNT